MNNIKIIKLFIFYMCMLILHFTIFILAANAYENTMIISFRVWCVIVVVFLIFWYCAVGTVYFKDFRSWAHK